MDIRTRLVNVIRDSLWECEHVATNSKEILNRVSVGQGSIHHHFPGKRDLAAVALEQNVAVMCAEAEVLLIADGTPVERVISYLER